MIVSRDIPLGTLRNDLISYSNSATSKTPMYTKFHPNRSYFRFGRHIFLNVFAGQTHSVWFYVYWVNITPVATIPPTAILFIFVCTFYVFVILPSHYYNMLFGLIYIPLVSYNVFILLQTQQLQFTQIAYTCAMHLFVNMGCCWNS